MFNNPNIEAFLHDLHKVQANPIFFLEEYWNKRHPGMKLDLTDDEKQQIYNHNKCTVTFMPADELHKYMKARDEAKKKGFKDWEIY